MKPPGAGSPPGGFFVGICYTTTQNAFPRYEIMPVLDIMVPN